VYGAILPPLSYTIGGFVTGDSAASIVHGAPALATKATAGSAAGVYLITPSLGTLSAANYTYIFVGGVMTVQKAVLTVTPINAAMVYGQQVPALSCAFQGFVNGDTHATAVSGVPAVFTSAVSKTKPGNAAITASLGSLTSENYSFAFGTGTLTIGKALLTVNPRAIAMSYGSKMPAFAFDLTGFVNGDSAAVVSGAPLLTTAAVSASPVGSYTIGGTVGTLASAMYSFAMASGSLTIQKAILTVTANSAAMIYGGALPALTYTVTGFVNGETAAVVSGLPSLTTVATARSPAGVYAVKLDATKLSSENYSFAAVNGAITVNKAVLTVTPAAVSMIYGASQPALPYQVGGFVKGDSAAVVSGAPVFKCSALSISPVGQYPIVGTAGSLSAANYSFQIMGGAITVNKAVLTVTASAASMTYGGELPALTSTVTGYVNGETWRVVTGAPILSTVASKTSPAGVYPVTSAAGTLSANNYNFVMVNGQLTVSKAVATVAANSQSMTYGAVLPAMTYTVSGLLNGDTVASAISGAAQMTASGGSGSPVGQYTINPALGTLASSNYSFQFKGGSLTVAKAALTVTANNLSMQAGSTVPALTYTVNGLVNGDTAASATSGTPSLATTAVPTSAAGSYPISIVQGNMAAGNYTLNFVKGTLTVTQSSTGSGHKLIHLAANSIVSREPA